jgi:hypothetical protein
MGQQGQIKLVSLLTAPRGESAFRVPLPCLAEECEGSLAGVLGGTFWCCSCGAKHRVVNA